jgi:hypothetical protein
MQSGFNVVLCGRTIESNQRALEKITAGLNRIAKKLYDNDEVFIIFSIDKIIYVSIGQQSSTNNSIDSQ